MMERFYQREKMAKRSLYLFSDVQYKLKEIEKCFTATVDHCTAYDLIPLIHQLILPETVVAFNKLVVYNTVENCPKGISI